MSSLSWTAYFIYIFPLPRKQTKHVPAGPNQIESPRHRLDMCRPTCHEVETLRVSIANWTNSDDLNNS